MRAVEAIILRLGAVAGLMGVFLLLTIVPDILARSIFKVSIYGMTEAGVMVLVFMVFLALPASQLRGELYSVVVFEHLLSARTRRIFVIVRNAISLVVSGILAYYSIRNAWASYLRNEATFAVVPFPVWPGRIAVALGFSLLTVQFAFDFVRALRGQERRTMGHGAAAA